MPSKTAAHLVAEAKARIENHSPGEIARELRHGHALLVNLRVPEERITPLGDLVRLSILEHDLSS